MSGRKCRAIVLAAARVANQYEQGCQKRRGKRAIWLLQLLSRLRLLLSAVVAVVGVVLGFVVSKDEERVGGTWNACLTAMVK